MTTHYGHDEQLIHVETGRRVDFLDRGRDASGIYVEIRRIDGSVERVHGSRLRPLNWRELLGDAIRRRKRGIL